MTDNAQMALIIAGLAIWIMVAFAWFNIDNEKQFREPPAPWAVGTQSR